MTSGKGTTVLVNKSAAGSVLKGDLATRSATRAEALINIAVVQIRAFQSLDVENGPNNHVIERVLISSDDSPRPFLKLTLKSGAVVAFRIVAVRLDDACQFAFTFYGYLEDERGFEDPCAVHIFYNSHTRKGLITRIHQHSI